MIPPSLRPEVLNIIHQGHLGQDKCLLRARTSVFWPGITKEIINQVNQCDPCQKYQRKAEKEPILQPEPPNRAWERLSSDLFEFKGQQYLILKDQYSRFSVIRRLTSTTSSAVINHLMSIFAEHGIPTQPMTENGLQYSSAEFKHFMKVYGRLLAPQCTPNQTGLLSEWSKPWRTSSKSAMKPKKTRTLLFCPTEPLPWQNC